MAARDPSLTALVPADVERPLEAMLREDGGGAWFRYAVAHGWSRALVRQLERAILPGIILHFLARKRWIERAVKSLLDEGFTQVVVIGAGLDTLVWRLHLERTRVSFWELDHPASQAPKAAALKGLAPASNLMMLPLDLRNELPSAVLGASNRFSRDRRTCFVAEGLLMYLPEERVWAVLADAAQFKGAVVVFTFMEPDPTGNAAFRGGSSVIEKWLRARSEPFAWGMPRSSVADFLAPIGLQVRSIAGADELRSEILDPAGLAGSALAVGECIAITSSKT
jgi:methyltransferase (TIGR00027 family)